MYGRFIRQVRESRGMTQAQIAEIIGSNQTAISAYEHDRQLPSAETLNRILVGCGYLLVADDGLQKISCDLPNPGWFDHDPNPVVATSPEDVSIMSWSNAKSIHTAQRHLMRSPLAQAKINEDLLSLADQGRKQNRALAAPRPLRHISS